jgi:hypothetical protein
MTLFTSSFDSLDDRLVFGDLGFAHITVVVEADLTHLVAWTLLEIGPGSVDNRHMLQLATSNAILLDELHALLKNLVGDRVDGHTRWKAQIHMSTAEIINVEPMNVSQSVALTSRAIVVVRVVC